MRIDQLDIGALIVSSFLYFSLFFHSLQFALGFRLLNSALWVHACFVGCFFFLVIFCLPASLWTIPVFDELPSADCPRPASDLNFGQKEKNFGPFPAVSLHYKCFVPLRWQVPATPLAYLRKQPPPE
jgi:hypothetical protein